MELPTTPIGKQQVIDLRAGAILRKECKPTRYLGCSAHVLLMLILLVKCALITAWLFREYESFGEGCSYLANGFEYDDDDEYESENYERRKRSLPDQDFLDPRTVKKKKHPLLGVPRPQSTMVTMTNTQVLPGEGENLKMKTIRSRLEAVSSVMNEDDSDFSPEEDLVEIELKGPPAVYIAPIMNRRNNEIDTDFDETAHTIKPKKKKGKGRKKKNKTTTTTTTEEPPSTKKKGKKGQGKKKHKNRLEEGHMEQTKAPRHLFSPPMDTLSSSTPRPHSSSFLHGAVDPADPAFSNQGHIRGFPMKKASKKPKNDLKLSKETRLMWEMDELNFTTMAMIPRTTEMTSGDEHFLPAPVVNNRPQVPPPPEAPPTTAAPQPPSRKDFYSTHKQTTWKSSPSPSASRVVPVTSPPIRSGPPTTTQQTAVYYEIVNEPHTKEMKRKEKDETTLEILARAPYSWEPTTTERSRIVKHGFDRSLDAIIEAGLPMQAPMTTEGPPSEEETFRFQDQLTSFTSSAVCVARSLFGIWCFCELLSALPFFIGICLGRKSLFVAQFVLDMLVLVVGFVFSITTVVFSVVLYILVGEMRRSTLLHWLVFAVGMDLVLVIYAFGVVVSLRCCERLVHARRARQATPTYAGAHEL